VQSKLNRWSGPAALIVALLALVFSLGGISAANQVVRGHDSAAKKAAKTSKKKSKKSSAVVPSTKPRALGILLLNKKKQFPASVVPLVKLATTAKNAQKLGGRSASTYVANCSEDAVDMGSWCLDSADYPLQENEIGKNDYFWASQRCVDEGGYLPTAAQLIGAAARLRLASTLDDSLSTASIDVDATDGLKDQAEMSATLITTAAGSDAAGSEGVTSGATGNPRTGEPNPVPIPADPAPETLQYVLVYDNHNHGGFAGSKPVSQPSSFRCAYDKEQGNAAASLGD